MSDRRQLFPPPPAHPLRRPDVVPSGQSSYSSSRRTSPVMSHPPSPSITPPQPSEVVSSTTSPAAPVTPTEARTLQPHRIPGSVEDFYDDDSGDDDTVTLRTRDEEGLSAEELRELYDAEEIERFLSLFSSYVTDVELPRTSSETGHLKTQDEPALEPPDASEDEGSGWVDAQQGVPATPSPASDPVSDNPDLGLGPATWAASKLLLLLPPPQPSQPPFSIKRARLAANRLFLALEPTYFPILKRLWDLATWKDFGTSLFYCFLYWIMWYNGLLLSGLLIRVLYALLRRKYLPYPNAAELRRYRRELELAENFSRSVILRVATSPAMSVHDAWTTFKEYRASRKRAKNETGLSVPGANASTPQIVVEEALPDAEDEPGMAEEELGTVTPDLLESEHVATPIMHIANRISDVHERIKNIFLWRRRNVSFAYALVLFVLGLFTAFVPAKYLAKLVTMGLGVFFWHVIPVLASLPPADRARIPPPLRHSSTDAEYAMELISQRVAQGLPVKPRRKKKRTPLSRADVVDGDSLNSLEAADTAEDRGVDWNKWGGRVVKTKAWAGDVKQVFKAGNWKSLDRWATINPLNTRDTLLSQSSQQSIEAHTFPAQRKGPGLITLTDSMLYYTPLASSTPELSIKLGDVLAVKKSGVARGLKIRWIEPDANGVEEERTERFLWVGDRDSLFAQLVGFYGNRRTKV